MGRKMQRLSSKLGSVQWRMSSTLSHLRDRSGVFPPTAADLRALQQAADDGDATQRHLQLHNTTVRALLVDEVVYAPSRLLKKSRRAVLLITGADLVLVKMTTATSTTHAGTGAAAAEGGAAAGGPAGSSAGGSAGGIDGSDGGDAPDDSQASVLAQHEHHKLVRCEASGRRLDLEFITTGSARFRVSAAALGFSSGPGGSAGDGWECEPAPPSRLPSFRRTSGSAASATDGSGGVEDADAGTAAAAAEAASEQQQQQQQRQDEAGCSVVTEPRSRSADDARQQPADAALHLTPSADTAALRQRSHTQVRAHAHAPARGLHHASSSPHGSAGGRAVRWSSGALSDGAGAGGPSGSSSSSRSLMHSLSSTLWDDGIKAGPFSNRRCVVTDEGDEYRVHTEAFTLQFRDAAMCALAASLLQSGRSNMRAALEWVKQGLPFATSFAVSHITELSASRAGPEVTVAGPTAWGTELQLPDSWAEAISTAQLPDDQPLHTPIEVPDGPAAFKVYLSTPAGVAEATLVPELLALLTAHPNTRGQLLAVPVHVPAAQRQQQPGSQHGQQGEVAAEEPLLQPAVSFTAPVDALDEPVDAVACQFGHTSSFASSCSNTSSDSHDRPTPLLLGNVAPTADAADDATVADVLPVLQQQPGLAATRSNNSSSSSIKRSANHGQGLLDVIQDDEHEGSSVSSDDGPGASAAVRDVPASSSRAGNCGGGAPADDAHGPFAAPAAVPPAVAAAAGRSSGSGVPLGRSRSHTGGSSRHSRLSLRHSLPLYASYTAVKQRLRTAVRGHKAHSAAHDAESDVAGGRDRSSSHVRPHGCSSSNVSVRSASGVGMRSASNASVRSTSGISLRSTSNASMLSSGACSTASSSSSLGSRLVARVFRRTKSHPADMGLLAGSSSSSSSKQLQQHHARMQQPLLMDDADDAVAADAGNRASAPAAHGALAPAAVRAISDRSAAEGHAAAPAPAVVAPANQKAPLLGAGASSAARAERADGSRAAAAAAQPEQREEQQAEERQAAQQQECRRQQQQQQLSFVSEVYAVLHVQLVTGSAADAARTGASQPTVLPSGAAASSSSSCSPFEAAAVPGTDAAAFGSGRMGPPAPSVLVLGSHAGGRPLGPREQQALSAAGLAAALLCGLAMLLMGTAWGHALLLAAAGLNAACMAAAARPAWLRAARRAARSCGRLASAGLASHGSAALCLQHSSCLSPSASCNGAAPPAAALCGGDGAAAVQHIGDGLRVRLLGGCFAKEALGLLEEQINAFRHASQQAAAAAAAGAHGDTAASGGPAALLDRRGSADMDLLAAHEGVALVSQPEPDWMTPDWRKRIIIARPTLEERRKLAAGMHAWRLQVGADTLTQRPPAHFDWFHQHLQLRLLAVTPQHHVVLLLKMATLVQMSRRLASSGLSPADMGRHCGFIWAFMFEQLAPQRHPGGRFIMVADMSGVRLGQAVGEGQIAGRALGEVCNAFPERLVRCLVLGTPSWFNMLFRVVRPHLSPNTRAKVQVCDGKAEAAAELGRCLGHELVPAEYGGPCSLAYEEYPAQQQLLRHVAKLRAAGADAALAAS